jgi:hypothetical protein
LLIEKLWNSLNQQSSIQGGIMKEDFEPIIIAFCCSY